MRHHGFSVVETVVAMAVMLAVTASVFALLDSGQSSFAAQPEVADMQQRLRVAADTLFKDLVMAGAGAYHGANTGSLGYSFAAVLPYRQGSSHDDPPGTFKTDTITLIYVPPTVAQTTLASYAPGPNSADVAVNADAGCPSGDALCGFKDGMTVLLYDVTGAYDTFTIANSGSNVLHLQPNGGGPAYIGYQARTTTIVQVTNAVYHLKIDQAGQTYQLMSYDGGTGPDVPVVDHLVALAFDYYGDPQPPKLTGKSLSDRTGPWTTYGPRPPAPGQQIPTRGYPAGENCAFMVDAESGLQVPRLAVLGAADGTANTLVQLTEAQLTDGPWCPDDTKVNRWDADLLRIRKIGVTIRVQAANAAMRGPAGVLFVHGGSSKGGYKWLPDQPMRFQVTPRNLGR